MASKGPSSVRRGFSGEEIYLSGPTASLNGASSFDVLSSWSSWYSVPVGTYFRCAPRHHGTSSRVDVLPRLFRMLRPWHVKMLGASVKHLLVRVTYRQTFPVPIPALLFAIATLQTCPYWTKKKASKMVLFYIQQFRSEDTFGSLLVGSRLSHILVELRASIFGTILSLFRASSITFLLAFTSVVRMEIVLKDSENGKKTHCKI